MVNKAKFKFILQKEDFDCGVAAVATLLLNAGYKAVSYPRLSRELKLSKNGVSYLTIGESLLVKKELVPKLLQGGTLQDLKREIKEGRICLILYQGWGNAAENAALKSGHYAVVVGYERSKIYLLDPSVYEDWGDDIGWRIIDEAKFASRWVDRDKNQLIRGWMVSIKPRQL